MTLMVVGLVGFWAWTGLKSPPISPSRGIITTPAGWQRMDAGSFTFYAPKGTQFRKVQSVDSVYGDIVGPNTCLRFEVAVKVGVLADKRTHPDYSESPTVVDGRRALVRKAVIGNAEQAEWFGDCGEPLYIGLYVPQASCLVGPNGQTNCLEFAIQGTAGSEDARDQVETIFKSIRFAS